MWRCFLSKYMSHLKLCISIAEFLINIKFYTDNPIYFKCVYVSIVSQDYHSPKESLIVMSLDSIFYKVKKGVKHISLL